MKTLYPQRTRQGQSGRKRLILVFGVFLFGSVFFSFFDGVIMHVVSPIWKSENVVSSKFWLLTDYFRTKGALIEENRMLKDKIIAESSLIESARSNQGSLDTLLASYGRASSTNFIASGVLVHPPETPYDILIIDAGSDNKVETGDTVYLPEGQKIGTVIETFTKNSKVKLYSANGEKTDAILERGKLPVSMSGRGGGSFELSLSRFEMAVVGDRVLAPSVDGALVGVVESVEVTPTDSFKKVLVRSIVNVYTVRFVVIKK